MMTHNFSNPSHTWNWLYIKDSRELGTHFTVSLWREQGHVPPCTFFPHLWASLLSSVLATRPAMKKKMKKNENFFFFFFFFFLFPFLNQTPWNFEIYWCSKTHPHQHTQDDNSKMKSLIEKICYEKLFVVHDFCTLLCPQTRLEVCFNLEYFFAFNTDKFVDHEGSLWNYWRFEHTEWNRKFCW